MKEIGFKYRESELLVQALKALGEDRIDQTLVRQLAENFKAKDCKKILKDTQKARTWVYEAIKKTCLVVCDKEVS